MYTIKVQSGDTAWDLCAAYLNDLGEKVTSGNINKVLSAVTAFNNTDPNQEVELSFIKPGQKINFPSPKQLQEFLGNEPQFALKRSAERFKNPAPISDFEFLMNLVSRYHTRGNTEGLRKILSDTSKFSFLTSTERNTLQAYAENLVLVDDFYKAKDPETMISIFTQLKNRGIEVDVDTKLNDYYKKHTNRLTQLYVKNQPEKIQAYVENQRSKGNLSDFDYDFLSRISNELTLHCEFDNAKTIAEIKSTADKLKSLGIEIDLVSRLAEHYGKIYSHLEKLYRKNNPAELDKYLKDLLVSGAISPEDITTISDELLRLASVYSRGKSVDFSSITIKEEA